MFVPRETALLVRDQAAQAIRAYNNHNRTCRACEAAGEPCAVSGMLQRGAAGIAREAEHALTAYMPKGTRVIYAGSQRQLHGMWTVDGPAPRRPWGAYVLKSPSGQTFVASLLSLRLDEAEAMARDRYEGVAFAASSLCAILARLGSPLLVTVDRTDRGQIVVTWKSSEYVEIEARALRMPEGQERSYLGSALFLLQQLRANVSGRSWAAVARVVSNVRRVNAQVEQLPRATR
ncbi:hypothetical protein [Planotetraspora phitsanulokensis]|uniref:Uncharacterized protein n=1 Tax=Planotetraspora phitsanulokensis TaxID=575192 RepID=A0A8J3XJ98_9ACTN|nr:hypothetical protein [Planotetraspora phitsanulokensis]GII42965.1 hypothetical protein Pph01_79680 [Planotetraspora phitsanulokensis]